METNKKRFSLVYLLMIFFCMTPFVFPFPGLETDMQPYALALSLLIIVFCSRHWNAAVKNKCLLLLLVPTFVAIIYLVLAMFSMEAFRATYNHVSIFIVTFAIYLLLMKHGYQETSIKIVLLIWFTVAIIQFLYDRTFLANIIAGERENAYGRGVVGLCSEASFFGISCFYFLHLANRFEKHRLVFLILITFMAVVLAQSMQGVFFVVIFYIGFALDNVKDRKGIFAVLGIVICLIVSYFILKQVAPNSRLIHLAHDFFNEGVFATIENDASANTRFSTIINSLGTAFEHWLIPQGFDERIGSGFGGLLVELGLFGLIETLVISYCLSIHFKSIHTRVIYYILVYIILFSNTQIGNPQLLTVLATNLFFNNQEKYHETAKSQIKKSRYCY